MVFAPADAERPGASSSSATGASSRTTCQSTCRRPQHLPGAPGQAGEDERREVPDGFLRTELAEAAAGEAAADGERQRDPLAGAERRQADHARRRSRRRTGRRSGRRGTSPRASGRRRRSCSSRRATTPAASGMPRLRAKISRSGQARRSKMRMCRNRRYRTSIVASAAMTASLTTSVVSRTCSASETAALHDLH